MKETINREISFKNSILSINENKSFVLDNKCVCVNSDCIPYMKKLKENNVLFDAIITDPPYNISKKNNFNTLNRAGIDFGEWDKLFDISGWIDYAIPILKPGGNIIIFSAWREMGNIAQSLEQNNCEVKTLIRWCKKNPMPRNVDRLYVSDVEYAIWGVKKGGKWTFNKGDCSYRRPLYESGVVCGKERVGHPTQKSIQVMKNIILTHTNENDIIFDPFSGSFTTMESALSCNRKFVGTELDEKWIDIAQNRCNK